MRGLAISLLVLASVLGGCNATGPALWHGVVHPNTLARAGLQYYWHLPVKMDRGERIARMFLLAENLYCLTNRNRLLALDAGKGVVKWSHQVADAAQEVFPPTHADSVLLTRRPSSISQILGDDSFQPLPAFDAVMINTLSDLTVLNRDTGEVIRKIAFDFSASTGGATDGQFFYVGATNGWYHAIRLQEAMSIWTLATGATLDAPVRYFGGCVFVGGQDNRFYAAGTGTKGREIWQRTLRGPVTAGVHVDSRGCFVPCEDNQLYAFDLHGKTIWEPIHCQGPLRDDVQVSERTVFQFARGDKFYAINLANGTQRWTSKVALVVLGIIDADVYALSRPGQLVILDEMLGDTKASLPLTGLDVFVPNVTVPAIYAAASSGHLFCIRPKAAGYLSPEMLKAK